jgi:hypothetical protein
MVTQTPDGRILFLFHRPAARQIVISGDFNGWQQSFHMSKGSDGWWRAQIQLAPGVYRFRYLADGQWFTDYAAFGLEPGPFGWNSVLQVEALHQDVLAAAAALGPVLPARPQAVRKVHQKPPLTLVDQPPPERRRIRRTALAGSQPMLA